MFYKTTNTILTAETTSKPVLLSGNFVHSVDYFLLKNVLNKICTKISEITYIDIAMNTYDVMLMFCLVFKYLIVVVFCGQYHGRNDDINICSVYLCYRHYYC